MALVGKKMADILESLEDIKNKTHLYVAVSTLENLVKGGRIGRGRALIGSLLNIKPVASLTDGIYTPIAKVRSENQLIKYLGKRFFEEVEGRLVKGIAIAHADALEISLKLKESLLSVNHLLEVKILETTPIISTHTGPGAFGFSYYYE
jgi:DegV family protein with EDD domain